MKKLKRLRRPKDIYTYGFAALLWPDGKDISISDEFDAVAFHKNDIHKLTKWLMRVSEYLKQEKGRKK